jgi:hypothetical protein
MSAIEAIVKERKDRLMYALNADASDTFYPTSIVWYCTKCKKEFIQRVGDMAPINCYNCK